MFFPKEVFAYVGETAVIYSDTTAFIGHDPNNSLAEVSNSLKANRLSLNVGKINSMSFSMNTLLSGFSNMISNHDSFILDEVQNFII